MGGREASGEGAGWEARASRPAGRRRAAPPPARAPPLAARGARRGAASKGPPSRSREGERAGARPAGRPLGGKRGRRPRPGGGRRAPRGEARRGLARLALWLQAALLLLSSERQGRHQPSDDKEAPRRFFLAALSRELNLSHEEGSFLGSSCFLSSQTRRFSCVMPPCMFNRLFMTLAPLLLHSLSLTLTL